LVFFWGSAYLGAMPSTFDFCLPTRSNNVPSGPTIASQLFHEISPSWLTHFNKGVLLARVIGAQFLDAQTGYSSVLAANNKSLASVRKSDLQSCPIKPPDGWGSATEGRDKLVCSNQGGT
jgi:hypothetical protein